MVDARLKGAENLANTRPSMMKLIREDAMTCRARGASNRVGVTLASGSGARCACALGPMLRNGPHVTATARPGTRAAAGSSPAA